MNRLIRKIVAAFLCVLSVAGFSYADTVASKMDQMLVDLIKLGTYFDAPERLYSASSRPEMIRLASHMRKTFKEASHFELLKEQSLLPSATILEESLASIEDSLKDKNMNYARLRFNSTRSICLSCHTQLDWKAGPDIIEKVNELSSELKLSNVDKGDIYSIVRDYTRASQYYLSELQNKTIRGDSTSETSLLRKILHIYLTGLTNVSAAENFFTVNQSSMNLSRFSLMLVNDWLSEIQVWSKLDKNISQMTTDEFISVYKKRDAELDDSRDGAREVINYLLLGKIGKTMMNTSDTGKDRAELLYYLGMADRYVDSNFLFNLSDLYFKECIRNYPKSKFAKKCYESYEDSVYQSFSGSAGVFIPSDIRAELKELKQLLNKN